MQVTKTRTAHDGPLPEPSSDAAGRWARDRLASFRVVYAAIFAFVVISIVTVLATEQLLAGEFREQVNQALRVSPAKGPIVPQIGRASCRERV